MKLMKLKVVQDIFSYLQVPYAHLGNEKWDRKQVTSRIRCGLNIRNLRIIFQVSMRDLQIAEGVLINLQLEKLCVR